MEAGPFARLESHFVCDVCGVTFEALTPACAAPVRPFRCVRAAVPRPWAETPGPPHAHFPFESEPTLGRGALGGQVTAGMG